MSAIEKRTFAVLGMMCAGCSARVEQKLNSLPGIKSAAVNLPSRTVLVEYDKDTISPATMQEQLAQTGYDMVIEEDRNVEAIERRALHQLRLRTLLSWLFALVVMSVSMGWVLSFLPAGHRNQLMLIVALLNLLYCGRPFYATAWRQLLHGSANMDTLVALSTAISFAFSTFNTFWGDTFWGSRGMESHTYFDASVMIITFVLTGRLLEERAKQGTASAIRSLMGLQPKTARLLDLDGNLTEAPISALQRGDTIEVRPGETIPVDGVVVGTQPVSPDSVAMVDEAMISGEAAPVAKLPGDRVLAGTIVRQGTFRFRAEQVGQGTVLAGIIKMVEQAQGSKAPVQRVVDRIALVFVPAVVGLSLITFVAWLLFGGMEVLPQAILSAVSVLVIACPCAMGLATPTALMVGIGKAAEKGILVKDATALEQLHRIDAMVIDKTGTLTMPLDETPPTPAEVPASPAAASSVRSGFAASAPLQPLHEQLKPHAREAMAQLQQQGVAVYMMSGDRQATAAYWAGQAGIAHFRAEVMPQDKEDQVRQLQHEGHQVAMVGDGINDSQALAAANVSIAMGQGTDVAMDVAQVTLMGTDLRRIPQAIDLSRRTVGMIRQNLFWAFIYNVVCIPLAAGLPHAFGLDFQITPMTASALMAFSSVSVVLNSLRLKLTK